MKLNCHELSEISYHISFNLFGTLVTPSFQSMRMYDLQYLILQNLPCLHIFHTDGDYSFSPQLPSPPPPFPPLHESTQSLRSDIRRLCYAEAEKSQAATSAKVKITSSSQDHHDTTPQSSANDSNQQQQHDDDNLQSQQQLFSTQDVSEMTHTGGQREGDGGSSQSNSQELETRFNLAMQQQQQQQQQQNDQPDDHDYCTQYR
jgi:hypothetical protein